MSESYSNMGKEDVICLASFHAIEAVLHSHGMPISPSGYESAAYACVNLGKALANALEAEGIVVSNEVRRQKEGEKMLQVMLTRAQAQQQQQQQQAEAMQRAQEAESKIPGMPTAQLDLLAAAAEQGKETPGFERVTRTDQPSALEHADTERPLDGPELPSEEEESAPLI